jgi:hypothetical protein
MVGNVRHGNFNRYLGMLYIIAQFAGGLTGSLFGKVMAGNGLNPIDLGLGHGDFL